MPKTRISSLEPSLLVVSATDHANHILIDYILTLKVDLNCNYAKIITYDDGTRFLFDHGVRPIRLLSNRIRR